MIGVGVGGVVVDDSSFVVSEGVGVDGAGDGSKERKVKKSGDAG